MASIGVSLSDREVAALRAVLSPKQYRQANFQATKRATRRGRVMVGDAVRSRLSLRKKFIDAPNSRDAAITDRFNGATQTGTIETRRIPLPLSEYPYTDTKTTGVSIRIDATKPALVLRHGFTATVRSKYQRAQGLAGHKGIFTRKKIGNAIAAWWEKNYPGVDPARFKGSGISPGETTSTFKAAARGRFNEKGYAWRLPIEERTGPAVFDVVRQDDVLKPTLAKIHDMYREEWGNQISRFTGGRIKSLSALTLESGDLEND